MRRAEVLPGSAPSHLDSAPYPEWFAHRTIFPTLHLVWSPLHSTVLTLPPLVPWVPVSLLCLNQPMVQGMDTGAGMVMLDPPVTVANVVPCSPYEFFLLKRINQV